MSSPKRQSGIALLLLVAALAMGATWYLVTRLRQLSLNHAAANTAYNAEVLNRAKQALIGYVAAQANKPGENNPGSLPCPEAPGSFNDVASGNDGKMNSAGCSLPAVGRYPWRTIGTEKFVDSAGEPLWYVVSPGWALTSVGANTVINSNSTGPLSIDGAIPAAAGDTVVALLIAPGPAINVPASSGCTAWSQSRSQTPNAAPDWRDYLECENATNPADANFVTTGPSGAFNDQVLKITVADIMPGIEAAVADRIHREIDPVLKTVYGWSTASTSSAWGHTTLNTGGSNVNSSQTTVVVASTAGMPAPNFRLLIDTELMLVTNVAGTTLTVTRGYEGSAATIHADLAPVIFGGSDAIYPYAAPFSDPSASAMQGAAGTYGGLLPLNYAETSPGSGVLCTAGAGVPRCAPTFVAWDTSAGATTVSKTGGTATITSSDCSLTTGAQVSCSITYSRSCFLLLNQQCDATLSVRIGASATNLGMAMRQVVTDPTTRVSATLSSPSLQVALGATGAGATSLSGALATASCPAIIHVILSIYTCTASNTATVTAPITVFSDHPLVDSTNADYGWFTRNKWHELTYYAIASGYSTTPLPAQPACTTGANCISVTNVTPSGGQRAILILAGRSINGSTRPSSTLSNYLELGNATAAYEKQTVTRSSPPFNDRIVVVDSN